VVVADANGWAAAEAALLREALSIHPEWQRARNYLAENIVAQKRLKDAKVKRTDLPLRIGRI
jgi:hypothetical protein